MATPAHVPPAEGLRNVLSCESVRSLAALVLEGDASYPEYFGAAYSLAELAERAAEAEQHAAVALVRAAALRRAAAHPQREAMHTDYLERTRSPRVSP